MWYFILYIGYDVWDSGEDLLNIEIMYLVWSVLFVFGVWYFVNVIVYGFLGIYYIELLDGFVIDNKRLKVGVVFDGIGILMIFILCLIIYLIDI